MRDLHRTELYERGERAYVAGKGASEKAKPEGSTQPKPPDRCKLQRREHEG